MFIIPPIDLSMKLSLSEVFVSNIIVTMVISNKSCCKHVLFTNLSDFISTTTRVTSLKSKKFLFCSFSVAKFGIAPEDWLTPIANKIYTVNVKNTDDDDDDDDDDHLSIYHRTLVKTCAFSPITCIQ